MSKEFKIKDVRILNWKPPGGKWWNEVEERPNEPLINALIEVQLSHKEYHKLLELDKRED